MKDKEHNHDQSERNNQNPHGNHGSPEAGIHPHPDFKPVPEGWRFSWSHMAKISGSDVSQYGVFTPSRRWSRDTSFVLRSFHEEDYENIY